MSVEIERVTDDKEAFVGEVVETLDEAARAVGKPFVEDGVNLRAGDGEGRFLGGLNGEILQGWFYVKLLAVSEQARSLGVGRQLLERAEAEARKRRLAGVYLDTFDFQAPGFYRKCGYTEIGRLPAVAGQPQRIWFSKTFD